MIQVRRLGHATFGTPDLERHADYWCNIMGLVVADKSRNRVLLSTKYGHEAIALEPGAAGQLKRLSFQVAPGSDLGELVRNLSGHGVKCERASGISPSVKDAVTFTDPKGTLIEVYADYQLSANDARDPVIAPLKFGHIAYRVNDYRHIRNHPDELACIIGRAHDQRPTTLLLSSVSCRLSRASEKLCGDRRCHSACRHAPPLSHQDCR